MSPLMIVRNNRRSHFAPCKRIRRSAIGQSNRLRNLPKQVRRLPELAQESDAPLPPPCPSEPDLLNQLQDQISSETEPARDILKEFDPLNPLAMVAAARWQRAHPDQAEAHQKVEIEEVERILPSVYMCEEDRAAAERRHLKKQTQAVLHEVKQQADLRSQVMLKDPRRVTTMKANKSQEMERRLVRQSTHAKELLQQIDSSRLKRSLRSVKSHGSLRSNTYVAPDDLKSFLGRTGCQLRLDEIDRIVVEHASHPFAPMRWDDIDNVVNNSSGGGISNPCVISTKPSTDYLFKPRASAQEFVKPQPFELLPKHSLEMSNRFGRSDDRYKATSHLTQVSRNAPGFCTERQRFGDSRQTQVEAEKARKREIDTTTLAIKRSRLAHLQAYAERCNRNAWRGEHDRIASIRRQTERYEAVFALQAERDIVRANKRKGKRLFEGIRR